MATTTNYSWTTPDDTALVKDGAAAIRSLGTSIDTTTKNLNPSTTLGDIEYRSSTANTNTRLGIGTTGQVLAVSGGVPAWTTPTGGGMTLLSTTTLSGTSTVISGISQAYNHLFITFENCTHSTSGVVWNIGIDGLSFRQLVHFVHGSTKTQRVENGTPAFASDDDGSGVYGYAYVYNYVNASRIRHVNINSRYGTSEGTAARWTAGTTTTTTAIDEITVDANGSTMSGGTVRIYGIL